MSRGRVHFCWEQWGKRRMRVCIAEVIGADGQVIWSDNSGAGAFPHLIDAAQRISFAATLMEEKGQRLESWSSIVDRAGARR